MLFDLQREQLFREMEFLQSQQNISALIKKTAVAFLWSMEILFRNINP